MSWALRVIFLTSPWIFNTGNLPRETSVTLLNAVSRGKRAISTLKSAPCNRTYSLSQAVTTRVLLSVSIMSARCGVVLKSGCAMDAKRCVSQGKIMKTGKKNMTEH